MGLNLEYSSTGGGIKPEQVYRDLFSDFWSESTRIEDSSLRDITRKAILTINTPLYALLVYKNTGDISEARMCHELVMDEARHILYLDNYYETGKMCDREQATVHQSCILEKLTQDQRDKLLCLETELFKYWAYERQLSDRLFSNDKISEQEIADFTLRKSTDVYLYAMISGFVTTLPTPLVTEIYHQQLRRDIHDDLEDLAEDYGHRMPNPLLMRLHGMNGLDFGREYSQDELLKLVQTSGVFVNQTKFLENHFKDHPIPDEYAWIRDCVVPVIN